ncbi:MAG: succinylglutamate desuccinylase/aspartoacylase family protein [Burkholderiaceae bacterium]|nr:succinylglutamate desuccinylase/aspartoacylase family protein [Burkholderiaceae bacterium]
MKYAISYYAVEDKQWHTETEWTFDSVEDCDHAIDLHCEEFGLPTSLYRIVEVRSKRASNELA